MKFYNLLLLFVFLAESQLSARSFLGYISSKIQPEGVDRVFGIGFDNDIYSEALSRQFDCAFYVYNNGSCLKLDHKCAGRSRVPRVKKLLRSSLDIDMICVKAPNDPIDSIEALNINMDKVKYVALDKEISTPQVSEWLCDNDFRLEHDGNVALFISNKQIGYVPVNPIQIPEIDGHDIDDSFTNEDSNSDFYEYYLSTLDRVVEGCHVPVLASLDNSSVNSKLMHCIFNEPKLFIGHITDENVNYQDRNGNTFLIAAILSPDVGLGTIQKILSHENINLGLADENGCNALKAAAVIGRIDIVKLIMKDKRWINTFDR